MTHLLTIERSKVQLVGVRGQWVVSSWQQMARFIELRLGQQHMLLFAEPVIAANAIDWFTAAEGTVRAFAQLNGTQRAALLKTTRRLVADLEPIARQFSTSLQADQALIGELLQGMLAFPDQSLFQVGEQPVVAGWGLRFSDTALTWQASAVLESKRAGLGLDSGKAGLGSARAPQGPQSADPLPAPAGNGQRPEAPLVPTGGRAREEHSAVPEPPLTAPAERAVAEPLPATTVTAHPWPGILGMGLALALLLALLAGLRGCESVALQWPLLPAGVVSEPGASAARADGRPPADALAVARQREYQLRQELAQLQATWLERQRACPRR